MTNHNTLVDAEGVPCANRGNALHDHTLKDVNSLLIQQKMPQKRNLQTITPSILIFLLKKTLEAQWLFISVEVRLTNDLSALCKAIIFEAFFFEGP